MVLQDRDLSVGVKDTNQLIYVLEHHQYATKHIDVLMFGTSVGEYILNLSMNVMVVCPQL